MKHLVIALVLILCAIPATAQGSKFNVNCDKGEKINKLLNTIAKAGAQPPVTINVSGTCKESVLIQNFDRLTLITKNGAVIIGPSKDVNAAVTVANSSFVALQGFLIQKGLYGVGCYENSVCNLTGLTVESATLEGVRFARSEGVLIGNVFRNNGFRGLNVVNGSKVLVSNGTSQGNGDGRGVRKQPDRAVCHDSKQCRGWRSRLAGFVGAVVRQHHHRQWRQRDRSVFSIQRLTGTGKHRKCGYRQCG